MLNSIKRRRKPEICVCTNSIHQPTKYNTLSLIFKDPLFFSPKLLIDSYSSLYQYLHLNTKAFRFKIPFPTILYICSKNASFIGANKLQIHASPISSFSQGVM